MSVDNCDKARLPSIKTIPSIDTEEKINFTLADKIEFILDNDYPNQDELSACGSLIFQNVEEIHNILSFTVKCVKNFHLSWGQFLIIRKNLLKISNTVILAIDDLIDKDVTPQIKFEYKLNINYFIILVRERIINYNPNTKLIL